VLLGADAGLRRGEIIALEQTDADYRRGQLSVARSDWCGVVGSPKGGGDGERVTETTLRGWMERSERAGGLPVTGHIHRLRHTFCSHLAMRGAPAKAIQELAGHADLSTTMRYMHLSPASLNQAIQLLEQRAVSPANTRGENGGRTPSSEANRKNHVLDRKRPHRDSKSFKPKLHFQTAARPSRPKRSRFLQLRLSSPVCGTPAPTLGSPAVVETFWRPKI